MQRDQGSKKFFQTFAPWSLCTWVLKKPSLPTNFLVMPELLTAGRAGNLSPVPTSFLPEEFAQCESPGSTRRKSGAIGSQFFSWL
jgi:hypothetical protein